MGPRAKFLSALACLVALVGCDHATKYAAKAELEGEPARTLIAPLLELRYVENTDMAFNLLSWMPENVRSPLLVVLGALAIVSLAVVLWRPRAGLAKPALLLILAGALGNSSDRLLRGYVVDFIHVSYWPVFNVADVCVTAGMALLCWTAIPRTRRLPTP